MQIDNTSNSNQNQPVHRTNSSNNQGNTSLTKKDLKSKISSRQDFVMIFGFERKLISWLFFASETIHNLAIYY